MGKRRVLLMYITPNSGHHRASLAIEKALRQLEPDLEILNIDSLNYINPVLEKIINKTYISVVKRRPEVWEYLYDNPRVVKNTQRLRELIHRFNSGKLKLLLDDFKPSVIVCTQAFPCGMVADYKISNGLNTPLIGVLTDYVAHSYWIYDSVDYYVVPSQGTKKRLIDEGIPENRIKILGIPVDPAFSRTKDKQQIAKKMGIDSSVAVILIMGGSHGLGPIKRIVNLIGRIEIPFQIIVTCGLNKKLYRYFSLIKEQFRKPLYVYGFIENIDEIMEISTLAITKPGGLTTAEALAKGLPLIIIRPIPGQEAKNTEFLLSKNVAVKAKDEQEVKILLQELLLHPLKLSQMRKTATHHARPSSSYDVAGLVIDLIKNESCG